MNRTKTGNRSKLSYAVLGVQHVALDSRRLSACEHFLLRSFAATAMRQLQIERHVQRKLLTVFSLRCFLQTERQLSQTLREREQWRESRVLIGEP